MSEVAEAAQEFVEKMTDIQEDRESSGSPETESGSSQKLTMEERKAKMEQLRRKMVRPLPARPSTCILTHANHRRGHPR